MNTALKSAASTTTNTFRAWLHARQQIETMRQRICFALICVGRSRLAYLFSHFQAFCLNYYSSLLLKIAWSGRADALYLRLSSRQTILLRVVPFKLVKRPLGMECNSLNALWQLYGSGWSSSFGRWNEFSWNLLWDRRSAFGEFMWTLIECAVVYCVLQCHNFIHRKCYHRWIISVHRTTIVRARAASIKFFLRFIATWSIDWRGGW